MKACVVTQIRSPVAEHPAPQGEGRRRPNGAACLWALSGLLGVVGLGCQGKELDVIVRPLVVPTEQPSVSSPTPSASASGDAVQDDAVQDDAETDAGQEGVSVTDDVTPDESTSEVNTEPTGTTPSAPAPLPVLDAGSPLDASLHSDAAPAPPDAAPEAGACPVGAVPGVELFRLQLRGSGRCLAVGQVTMSEGVGAFDTRFAEDCTDDDAHWEFIFNPYPAGYQLRNFFWGLSLELRNDVDENGSDAVLILPGPEPTQLFRIWSLPPTDEVFVINPLQGMGRCLGSGDNGKAEIWDCIVDNAYQQWLIVPVVCKGDDAGFVAPPIGG